MSSPVRYAARVWRGALVLLFATALLALVPGEGLAAAGDFDSSFGVGGMVTTEIGSYARAAWAVVIQPDGKIVVGGSAEYHFALARYSVDGSLDTSFDGDGMLITQAGGLFEAVYDLAIQPDGRIVAAGTTSPAGGCCQFALARFNTGGSLDTSFDGDGKVTTPFVGLTEAFAVAVQPDGKIVAAGHAFLGAGGSFALARYNADGSLDTSFDGDGKVVTSFGVGNAEINAIAIQPDGRIVVSGIGGPNSDFALASLQHRRQSGPELRR